MTENKKRGRPPKRKETEEAIASLPLADESQMTVGQLFQLLQFKLQVDNLVIEDTIFGYDIDRLKSMIENPVSYQQELINISNYMYRFSGYYKNIIDYHVNMAMYRWTIDTQLKIYPDNLDIEGFRKDMFLFTNGITSFNLEQEFSQILLRVFLEDCCFGYWLENNQIGTSTLYYLNPKWCSIKTQTNGIYGLGIDGRKVTNKELEKLPKELQKIINSVKGKSGEEAYALIPPDKSFVLKYNNHFTYLYPPFTYILSSILDILSFKDLTKVKTEQDVERLLALKIPIDEDQIDSLMLSGKTVVPFINMVKGIVNKGVGVFPTPMSVEAIDWKQTTSSEINRVENAEASFFQEAGISSAMLGSGDNSSTLKQSIQEDFSDLRKLLIRFEKSIQLKLDLMFNFKDYRFLFKMLDEINLFNHIDITDKYLKNGQYTAPIKMRWLASLGITPDVLFGNAIVENEVYRDIFDNFTALKSSHTSSSSDENTEGEDIKTPGDTGGKPQKKEEDLTEPGIQTRDKTEQ